MKASSEEQHVEQAIKTFSATTLRGVQIVNRWVAPDGTWYSLAELDLAAMTGALDEAKELDAKVRDYVRKNAERVMGDLDKEESKRAGGSPAAPAPAAEAPVAQTPPPAPPTCKTGQVLQCGQCLDVAGSLDKIRWEMPCVAGHGVVCRSAVVSPAPQTFDGQFIQIDVVSVTPATERRLQWRGQPPLSSE